MEITKRDQELLSWVNRFGCVDIYHVCERYHIKNKRAYVLMKRLLDHGYLNYQRVFHRRPGVYWLTAKGQTLCGSELCVLRHIALPTCRHELCVVSVAHYLETQYGGEFITERQIRHEAGSVGVGRHGHVSDGVFLYQNQRIAIEVELTHKGSKRLQQIHHYYKKQVEYDAVWYFCGDQSVQSRLENIDKAQQLFQVKHLETVCPANRWQLQC